MAEKIKGKKNGLCNRTACQSPDGVIWFNDSTRAYYCRACADLINDANYVDNGCKNLCHIEEEQSV